MKLVGMLDSPYVRRVAISLELYGIEFVHEPLSVFRTYAEFAEINPVVKAPTLVLDDGTVLMDSSLILDYLETLAPADKKLLPRQPAALARDLHALGLALAACEKSVQIVYEHNLRPAEKQHAPWLERVSGQLLAAYGLLDKHLAQASGEALTQASLTAAGSEPNTSVQTTQIKVGGGLPPTAVAQTVLLQLTHPYREQTPSHI